jgi:hypothetical protein
MWDECFICSYSQTHSLIVQYPLCVRRLHPIPPNQHICQSLAYSHFGDQLPTGVNLSVIINERSSSLTCYLRIYVSSFPSIQVHH